jgi:hypothetical protein
MRVCAACHLDLPATLPAVRYRQQHFHLDCFRNVLRLALTGKDTKLAAQLREEAMLNYCPHCRMPIRDNTLTWGYKSERYHFRCFEVVARKRQPEEAEKLIRQAQDVIASVHPATAPDTTPDQADTEQDTATHEQY